MRFVACLALLALAGCNGEQQQRASDNASLVADENRIATLETEIEALNNRVGAVENENRRQDKFAVDTYNELNDAEGTITKNAHVYNEAAASRMTANGDCGTELYYDNSGYPRQRNKECTVKDLHP